MPGQETTTPATTPGLVEIQKAVAAEYGVAYADLFGPGRSRRVAEPRQVTMFMARDLTTLTLHAIGRHFGRDHSTVLHAEQRIPELAQESGVLAARLERIRTALLGAENVRAHIFRLVKVYEGVVALALACGDQPIFGDDGASSSSEGDGEASPAIAEHIPPLELGRVVFSFDTSIDAALELARRQTPR